jgi:hypothetical protein
VLNLEKGPQFLLSFIFLEVQLLKIILILNLILFKISITLQKGFILQPKHANKKNYSFIH